MAGYQQVGNPFEDPAVRAAAVAGVQPEFDYNPFDTSRAGSSQVPSGNSTIAKPSTQSGATALSSSSPTEELQPAVTVDRDQRNNQANAVRVTTEELERRQKELEAKAAEIERRERELLKQTASTRQFNWPPFPPWFCIRPCFFQDFDHDISPTYQGTVKFGYGLWLAHASAYLLNVVGGMCYFFGSDLSEQAGTTFGLCLLFAIIFIPLSLLAWYRPLYKAFRDDSSMNFFIFFIIMFAQFATCVIWAIGIPGWGSAGVISGMTTVARNLPCGIIIIFCGVVWGVLAALDFALLIRVHRLYRTTGASFERARQELANSANQEAGRTLTQAAFGTFSRPSSR